MAATNQQVQNFSDQVVRPLSEAIVSLKTWIDNAKAQIGDVYANLTAGGGSTWTDGRTDGPPHLLTPADLLAFNAWITAFQSAVNTQSTDGNVAQMQESYAVIENACVRGSAVV